MVSFHGGHLRLRCGDRTAKKMFPLPLDIAGVLYTANFSINSFFNSPLMFVIGKGVFEMVSKNIRVRSFGMIRKRITDARTLESRCIKGTDESTLGKDFLVSFDAP